jgi:ribosomal protein S18 acetylase RimI-like enzyme
MSDHSDTIEFRPLRDSDLEFLFALYASTREEELAPVPWSAEQKHAFLRQQFQAQHSWYQQQYSDSTFDVVLVNGVDAGRLYVQRAERELRIIDIALMPAYRRRGIGARLLADVITEAEAADKCVSIHVEAFNPARRLYERLGFVHVQDRGVYILMERAPSRRSGEDRLVADTLRVGTERHEEDRHLP